MAASRIIYCLPGNSLFFSSRAEVSSSSSLDSPVQSAQQVSVQVLLHSQCLQTSEQGQRDCEILSSQQDLFETDKTGKYMQTCSGWGYFFTLHWISFLFCCPFYYLLLALIVTQFDRYYTQQLCSTCSTPKSDYFRTTLVSMVTYQ